MGLFRRDRATEPEPAPAADPAPGARKDRPTPSRREAEAARRQRVHRNLTKKEARALANAEARERRMKAMNTREAIPERQLMRDFVDSRFNIGEYLLPSVVVILAVTMAGAFWPRVAQATTLIMYLFIIAVIFDGAWMWRRYKALLAQRYPKASPRGLMMYGISRSTQLRRFRLPPPRIKRGEKF